MAGHIRYRRNVKLLVVRGSVPKRVIDPPGQFQRLGQLEAFPRNNRTFVQIRIDPAAEAVKDARPQRFKTKRN